MLGARLAVSGATAALVIAAGIAVAPTSAAAELSSACAYLNGTLIDAEVGESGLIVGDDPGFAAGDVLTLRLALVAGSVTSVDLRMLDPDLVADNAPDPFVTVASTSTVPGSIVYVIPPDRAVPEYVSMEIIVNGPGVVSVTSDCRSTTPAAVIPDWQQAYGRASSDAACQAGWAASWQAWAVPVTGGWVCTRSIPSLG